MAEAIARALASYAVGLIEERPFKCFVMLEDDDGNRFWAANGRLRSEFLYERRVENRIWGMFEMENVFTNSLIANSSSDRSSSRLDRDNGQSSDVSIRGQSSPNRDQSSRDRNQSARHSTLSPSPQIRDRSPNRNRGIICAFECRWENCGCQFEDLGDLIHHIDENPGSHCQASSGEYICLWQGCTRQKKDVKPFSTAHRLVRHIKEIHIKALGRRIKSANNAVKDLPSSKRARVYGQQCIDVIGPPDHTQDPKHTLNFDDAVHDGSSICGAVVGVPLWLSVDSKVCKSEPDNDNQRRDESGIEVDQSAIDVCLRCCLPGHNILNCSSMKKESPSSSGNESNTDPSHSAATIAAQRNLDQSVDTPLTTVPTPLSISQRPPSKDDLKEEGVAVSEKATNSESISLLNKKVRSLLDELQNDRIDHNSPLHSIRSFEEMNLKPEILRGIYGMGFNHPSKIQEIAIPSLLADPPKDIIAQSQSGTGKTVAFAVATLQRIDHNLRYPQAVILSPSDELALQTGEVVERLSKYCTDFKIAYALRESKPPWETGESKPPWETEITEQIVIGTPKTVLEWANDYTLFDWEKVKVFVLDDADARLMTLDDTLNKYPSQSKRLLQRLPERKCQRLFFSAAFDSPAMEFAKQFAADPLIIRLRPEEECLDNIRQYYLECRDYSDKREAIVNLYETLTIGQSVIFCSDRKSATRLAQKLTEKGRSVGLLTYGLRAYAQRMDVVNRFKAGNTRILISHESLRGIDVAGVKIVINFELLKKENQPDFDSYLHRIGRTGRFGKKGLVINMVDGPRCLSDLKKISKHFGKPIDKLDIDDIDKSDH